MEDRMPLAQEGTPPQEAWIRTCEQCLRASDFTMLASLLARLPGPECAADARFYQGRIAINEADFDSAVRLFWDAGKQAGDLGRTAVQQRSRVWEAYTECHRGNYDRAQEILGRLTSVVAASEPLFAEIFFVRGLIASEHESLSHAQQWLEKALDIAKDDHDLWMEARCCANLAAIYDSRGLLDYSSQMIRRVETINADRTYDRNPQQLTQVRNIHIHNLRLRGDLERASRFVKPLIQAKTSGIRLFDGYIALTTAAIFTDMGEFSRAETMWSRANDILSEVRDDHRTKAELLWEKAWLCLRQKNILEGYELIQEALFLLNDKMETECWHGYVVSAIIDIQRNDLGTVSLILRQASEHFRKVGHTVGLASVLLHSAAYHLRHQRRDAGRYALAEALMIMWQHKLYGTYYWEPGTMSYLCQLAIQEELWEDQATTLVARICHVQEQDLATIFQLEEGPESILGEFATSLAIKRLARDHWEDFLPSLAHTQPHVRRRAARIMHAAQNPRANTLLAQLGTDPDAEVQKYSIEQSEHVPPIQVYSFGQYRLLLNGQPIQLSRASTSRVLLIFATLLIAGEQGVNGNELAFLLWPDKPKKKRTGSLYAAISNLRGELCKVLAANKEEVIRSIDGRYYMEIDEKDLWWDWNALYHISLPEHIDTQRLQEAESLYKNGSFMTVFSEITLPQKLDQQTEYQWERIARMLCDMAADKELEADDWVAEIRKTAEGNEPFQSI